MRVVDTNILVYAHRRESPDHEAMRDWLDAARRGERPLGLTDVVLAGFHRLVTTPRIFRDATSLDEAIRFVEALLAGPAARRGSLRASGTGQCSPISAVGPVPRETWFRTPTLLRSPWSRARSW